MTALSRLVWLVNEVDTHYCLAALANLDVTHVDILVDTATASVCLDAQHAVEVWRVHLAVLCKDVLHAAADLRTYYHAAVAVLHGAVAHDDVLTWNVGTQTVAVASALQCDAVVASSEGATLDEHVLARLWVAAVAVRTVVDNGHVAYGKVLAEQWVHHPERRVEQLHAFDEHVLALHEVHQLWTQALALAEDAVLYRHVVVRHIYKVRACTFFSCTLPLGLSVVAVVLVALHVPPTLVAAVAVNGAFAGEGDILAVVGVDAWLVVHQVETLPTGVNEWVERRVEGEAQCGILGDDKVDVALQRYGTSHKRAGRNDNLTAASLGAGCNCLVDGLLVLGGSSGGACAVLRDVVLLRLELGGFDTTDDLVVDRLVPSVSHQRCRNEG